MAVEAMAFEYAADMGTVRLERTRQRWFVKFRGSSGGRWASPAAAAAAVARHESGLHEWDTAACDVSGDLLDWRPIGDSL